MGISFICAQFSMTHLLGCFERHYSMPHFKQGKSEDCFLLFLCLKTPQGPNKFEQNGPRHAGFRRHLDGYPCLRE